MNATVDLTRARVVEFDTPATGHEFLVKRDRPGIPAFYGTKVDSDGKPEFDAVALAFITTHGESIRILAEFPLTLADLIPEDCQAFQFSSKDTSITDTAVYDTTFNAWEVTGHDGCHATLESLALEFDIDLDTVIPLILTAHPDYVEARR